jgi:hypothetical protein
MKNAYDIIADVHGHHDKLTALLAKLGYRREGETHRHPDGRRVVFLGDFIDRGPEIREVLHTVKGMMDAGDAFAVMGNHEYSAIAYATPDGKGGYLKDRAKESFKGHLGTLRAFEGLEGEWAGWIDWFRRLPLFLDFGDFRCVHAAWDETAIRHIAGKSMEDPGFLRESRRRDSKAYRAVEHLLCGPEVHLPDGYSIRDKEGKERVKIRSRWWDLREGVTFGEVCMPEPMDCPHPLLKRHLKRVPDYPHDAPPAFVGHYWLPPGREPGPLRHNVICLDHSAGLGGPLVACRWNGPEDMEFVATK